MFAFSLKANILPWVCNRPAVCINEGRQFVVRPARYKCLFGKIKRELE